MAVVRQPDGSLAIQTSDGLTLPWHMGEDRLKSIGLEIPPPHIDPNATADTNLEKGKRGITFGDMGRAVADWFTPTPGAAGAGAPVNTGFRAGIPREEERVGFKDIDTGEKPLLKNPLASGAAPPSAAPSAEAKRAASESAAHGGSGDATEAKPSNAPKPRGGASVVDDSRFSQGAPGDGGQQFAGPRPHLVKGGDQRVAFSTSHSNLNPESVEQARLARADSSIDRKLAAQTLSDVQATADQGVVDQMTRDLDNEQQAIGQQAKLNTQRANEFALRKAGLDQQRADIEKLDRTPEQIIGDRPAWAKILSGIAILAGGALQGMRGLQENPGLKAVNDGIERSIRAQREARDMKMQGYKMRDNELMRLEQIYGTPEAAEQALRQRQRDFVKQYALKNQMNAGVQGADAALQAQFADWDKEAAQTELGLDQALAGNIAEQYHYIPPHTIGGTPALKPEQRERLVTFDNGRNRGFVVAGPAREKVQTGITMWEDYASGIKRLEELAPQASVNNPDAVREYESLASTLKANANVAAGQGAISHDDEKRVTQGIPDIGELTTTRHGAGVRLKAQRSLAHDRYRSIVRDNVYADPNASMPALAPTPAGARHE
jgi:hypothetical protein